LHTEYLGSLVEQRGAVKGLSSSSLGDVEDLIHNFLIIMLEHSMRQKDGWKVAFVCVMLLDLGNLYLLLPKLSCNLHVGSLIFIQL